MNHRHSLEQIPFWATYSRYDSPQHRRLSLFSAVIDYCLESEGMAVAQRDALIEAFRPRLAAWLESSHPLIQNDILQAYAGFLTLQGAPLKMQASSSLVALRRAFAYCMMEQASREVGNEARRTGHEAAFKALRPYLDHDPASEQAIALARNLDFSEAAMHKALERLRRRFRQRIESILSLCADTTEGRSSLRSQLRTALNHPVKEPMS